MLSTWRPMRFSVNLLENFAFNSNTFSKGRGITPVTFSSSPQQTTDHRDTFVMRKPLVILKIETFEDTVDERFASSLNRQYIWHRKIKYSCILADSVSTRSGSICILMQNTAEIKGVLLSQFCSTVQHQQEKQFANT